MQSLLSNLWSLVLPVALALCAALTLLSLLAQGIARWRTRAATPVADSTSTSSTSTFCLPFALPLAPLLLLLALWLSPQTVATTATLLARQSPDALRLIFLAAPLALLFLWCEGSSVAGTGRGTSPTTPLEHLAARVFSSSLFSNSPFSNSLLDKPQQGNLAYSMARVSVMLFALCCLASLLLDLVPTLAHLFWQLGARASLQAPAPITPSGLVSMLGMGLLLTLALPQFFPQPNKAIAWLLLLLLPCVLLFYGALCLVAARKAVSVASEIASFASPSTSPGASPRAAQSMLNADTLLATLGIFRPAFGWLALLCCVSSYTYTRTYTVAKQTTVRRKAVTIVLLCLAFACLLGFIGLTAAPIVASKAWLLGGQGLQPLHAAFLSLYPNEGWLLEAGLAALSATTLLALSALLRAALTLVHAKAATATLTLLMLATTIGLLTGSGQGRSDTWQASLLLALQHTQGIGQLAQAIATLLFLAALSTLALRALATLRQ